MNTPTLTGTYIAVAGVVVTVLTYFGINATVDQIASVIGAVAIVYGLVHQIVVHKTNPTA